MKPDIEEKLKGIISGDVILKSQSKYHYIDIFDNSSYIFDFRKAFLSPHKLSFFVEYFLDFYEKETPFQIGCVESGSIPLLGAILLEAAKRKLDINGFFVRKQRKKTGLGNMIEGELNDKKIIFIDDILNSGKTLRHFIEVLEFQGRKVSEIFTFLHFSHPDLNQFLSEKQISHKFVFTKDDFSIPPFPSSLSPRFPVIYPLKKHVFSLPNSNKFLFTQKNSFIKEGNFIYTGGEGGVFYCFDVSSLRVIWTFTVGRIRGHKNLLSRPLIVGEKILFGSYDGNFYCLDKVNGKTLWVNSDCDFIGSSATFDPETNSVFVGGEFAASRHKGCLLCVDIQTGQQKGMILFDDFVHSSPSLSSANHTIIIGSNDGTVLGVDTKSGDVKWSFGCRDAVKGFFCFDEREERVYFGSHDKNFYCLDAKTGKLIFSYPTENIIYIEPLCIGNEVFFGGLDQNFYHLSGDGKLIHKIETFGRIFSSPIFIEGKYIVFASNDGYTYFYNYQERKVDFVLEHSERIVSKVYYDRKYKVLYIYDFINQIFIYNLGEYL